MSDFRGDIRRAIFQKLQDYAVDITPEANGITQILSEFSKRYKNFDQLEKLNIELTVPIQLPPSGKKGDCKAVVLEVQKSFNLLGGGARIFHAVGSWLDDEKNVVPDHCVVVYVAIPIKTWYECIPVLHRLIRDEIQSKLFQECVFLRIDNQTFGEPLNILGDNTKNFPNIAAFGSIDSTCLTMMGMYDEQPIQTVFQQDIQGDGNTQMASGGDTIAAMGKGAMAAKGNITIINNHSLDPKMQKLYEEKIANLEEKLAKVRQENDEERQKKIALEASKLAEEMQKNKNIVISPYKLYQLAEISIVAGQYELAEGQAKQALSEFELTEDLNGIGSCIGVLAQICLIRRKFEQAERYLSRNLSIAEKMAHPNAIASTCNNLGLLNLEQKNYEEAHNFFLEAMKFYKMIGNLQGVSDVFNNIGNIYSVLGDHNRALESYLESRELKIKFQGTKHSLAGTMNNIGNEYRILENYVKSKEILRECIELCQSDNFPLTEADALCNLGLVEIAEKNYIEAKKYLHQGKRIYQKIGLQKEAAEITYLLERI